ncbi:MAG: hypothetical protein K2X41_01400 [Hyphomicrobium sp.]|nr:hypothetical protein [Hyphomicrobium sp.]
MSERLRSLAWTRVLSAAAVMGLGLFGTFAATSSETLLRNSFTAALDVPDATPQRLAGPVQISGSEDFWLSAMRQDGRTPVTKAVSIGDQISLSLGGERRTLEVASVAEVAPQVTEIDTGPSASRFVLVTARDTAKTSATPIRFVMEIDAGPVATTPVVTNRAL